MKMPCMVEYSMKLMAVANRLSEAMTVFFTDSGSSLPYFFLLFYLIFSTYRHWPS